MDMNNIRSRHVALYENNTCRTCEKTLIGEEPLLIRIEDQPYSVIMRTPGEEIPHAAGFCLGEGIVDEYEDFAAIGYCGQTAPNAVTVKLQPARRKKAAALLKRGCFISQTSCGICGKEMMEELRQVLTRITDETVINVDQAIDCTARLNGYQGLYKKTRAAHAAMLFDAQLNVLSSAEDVGRHNALDKAIGKLFLSSRLAQARLAVLSSRISYELIQKAARAHLSILISMSRPTSLAVELGQSLNMTLACLARPSGLLVFCGEQRLEKSTQSHA
ncbi:MAG: formate dehydrogenase accessory sulfurtransferase FdhD [Deltaproteobacteria bacterium]|nr:MAG: formate dehydrogenase accessory sulfurtransferase FdhD [Deltaproteobacteria bacterium]